ncbi:hypothetical protein [Deinococcus fonticola]|uniref:hypothetical protein n=1 Tax=Deinococcus fonticola TaxID=2528713 RepID=UPI00107547DA|nr:hypothetical protein [Deinococcus fonticola]
MSAFLAFISGCGLTRTQASAAHIMLALAIYMLLPIERPVLWVLEEWGSDGEVMVPGVAWAAVFAGIGLGILASKGRRSLATCTILAAVVIAIVAAAGVLTQGVSAKLPILAVLMLHIIGSARDAMTRPHDPTRRSR